MAKKTYNEKLHSPGGLPKIEDLSEKPESVKRLGGTKMLIAAPMQYNEIMAKISYGKVTTVDRVRAYLAIEAKADVTCPLTAGIFINICAHASVERAADAIPWWRTLKSQGELNEKYPEGQRLLLEAEGHTIIQKGKRYFVSNFEKKLFDLGECDRISETQ
ncbi:MAG: MGMT family protein [Oscillospiraceae bacterium]